jgi:3D (Asp-Asp-Asp) domain-containing protein
LIWVSAALYLAASALVLLDREPSGPPASTSDGSPEAPEVAPPPRPTSNQAMRREEVPAAAAALLTHAARTTTDVEREMPRLPAPGRDPSRWIAADRSPIEPHAREPRSGIEVAGTGLDELFHRLERARSDPAPPARDDRGELFRNSYSYFPTQPDGPLDTPLYDAACSMIALVPRSFHDSVCVQGSGRLSSGETVSFSRRACACASVCPKTGQQICFDKLDAARFPAGRGATGRPIQPLRTVAIDPSVIPLGSKVFIPELIGIPRPDGSTHDGCFVAEDRGLRVVGRHIDVFAGDIETMRRWNAIVPTHRGIHVRLDEPRCAGIRLTAPSSSSTTHVPPRLLDALWARGARR